MRVPWVALGRWNSAGGRWCCRERIYFNVTVRGRRYFSWTPLVWVRWRYGKATDLGGQA